MTCTIDNKSDDEEEWVELAKLHSVNEATRES